MFTGKESGVRTGHCYVLQLWSPSAHFPYVLRDTTETLKRHSRFNKVLFCKNFQRPEKGLYLPGPDVRPLCQGRHTLDVRSSSLPCVCLVHPHRRNSLLGMFRFTPSRSPTPSDPRPPTFSHPVPGRETPLLRPHPWTHSLPSGAGVELSKYLSCR